MIRKLLLIALALVLAGCSALDMRRGVAQEDLPKFKRVGVTSILGDSFYGISIGTTVFNNSQFKADVDWKVDAYAAKYTRELLAANKQFEVAELDRSNLSIAQVQADKGKLLWEAAQRQGFDKLVILWPSVSDNYPFFKPGYGLFERSMFGNGRTCVYAAYVVNVYDVATQKSMAWEWGGGGPCELSATSGFSYKKSFDAYSDEEKEKMRQALEAYIRKSVQYSLKELALLPATAK